MVMLKKMRTVVGSRCRLGNAQKGYYVSPVVVEEGECTKDLYYLALFGFCLL